MVPVRFNPSTMTFIGIVLTEGGVSTRRGLYRDIASLDLNTVMVQSQRCLTIPTNGNQARGAWDVLQYEPRITTAPRFSLTCSARSV